MDTDKKYNHLIENIKDSFNKKTNTEELLKSLASDTIKLYSLVYFDYRKNEIIKLNENFSVMNLDENSHNSVMQSLIKVNVYCNEMISSIYNADLSENIKRISASKMLDLDYKELESVKFALNRALNVKETATIDYLPNSTEQLLRFSEKVFSLEKRFFKDNQSSINQINTIDNTEEIKHKVKIKPH
jgi:hypothetical protein